jgi:hypothetical protein
MKNERVPTTLQANLFAEGGHCWPSRDGACAAVVVWHDKAAIGREVARSNGPLMESRVP